MTYQLPGSVISAADQAKGAAQAAIDAAKPKLGDMVASVTSGSLFAAKAPDLSGLTSIGVDVSGVTTALADAQKNMAANLATAQTAIMTKAKMAAAQGNVLSAADIDASLGPLKVMKDLRSTVASALSAAQSLMSGGLDPVALASAVGSLGSSLTSTFSGMTASAASAKAALNAEAQAIGLVSSLTKPMIPQLAAIVAENVDSSKIDKLTVIKTLEAPPPATIVPAKDPVYPEATNAPAMGLAAKTTSPSDRLSSGELNALLQKRIEANTAWGRSFGLYSPTSSLSTPELVKTFTDWVLTHLTPEEQVTMKARFAIKVAKPDATTRTEEENNLYNAGNAIAAQIKETDWHKNYQTKLDLFRKLTTWYTQAFEAFKADQSRFTLPPELEQYLRTLT